VISDAKARLHFRRLLRVSGSAMYRTTENTYSVNVRGETIATRLVPPQTFTARLSPLTIQVDRGVVVAGHVMYRDGTPVLGMRFYGPGMHANGSSPANGWLTSRQTRRLSSRVSLPATTPSMCSTPIALR